MNGVEHRIINEKEQHGFPEGLNMKLINEPGVDHRICQVFITAQTNDLGPA